MPYGTVIDPESGVVYVPEDPESDDETANSESGENDSDHDGILPDEVDPENDAVYDTQVTPTPDPRDEWFDSMYNQNRD